MELVRNITTLEEWGKVIDRSVADAVTAILRTGDLLVQARAEHPSAFKAWLEDGGCSLTRPTAYRMILIAQRLSRISHARFVTEQLPAQVTALYEVSKLSIEELEEAVSVGLVRPDMTEREARQLARSTHPRPYTADDVRAARTAVEAGAPIHQVAKQYQIPDSTLRDLVVRKDAISPHRRRLEQKKITRFVREMMHTVDALVSSLEILDTKAPTFELEPSTWPWVDSIQESLHILTRFSKELTRARAKQQADAEDIEESAPALGPHRDDAG
jgi:hypothetical protein